MSRDEILYTGVSSVRPRNRREILNEEKIEKQTKITPAAQTIFDEIEKAKKESSDISTFIIGVDMSPEDIKAQLLARKLYHGYLVQLQIRIKNILKAKPIKESK